MTQAPEVLRAGQEVRWKRRGRWRHGHLGDPPAERDGSLRVFDDFNGGARTLRPADVQARTRGPRGGLRWTWVDVAQVTPGGNDGDAVRRLVIPRRPVAKSEGLGL